MKNVLEMKKITKRFPGVLANDRSDFELQKGEIHVLLGENGAGKSTLMNILYGLIQPDEGEILINGETVQIESPFDALAHGIGMVHQHFMLVPNMTVAQNIAIGKEPKKGFLLNLEEVAGRIRKLSEDFGLELDPNRKIYELSPGEQQRVEIFKALYRGADILILDEPTSVLSPPEVESLFQILKSFKEKGKSVILITHKLHEVMNISDRITVMRRGKVQGTVYTKDIDKKELAQMLVGREVTLPVSHSETEAGREIISLTQVSVEGEHGKDAVCNFDLEIHAGEIVGIAGVDGNGQRELAEALVGLKRVKNGKICMEGQEISDAPVWKRIDMGLRYVPAERKLRGVAPDLSIAENMALKNYRKEPFCVRGVLKRDVIRTFAREMIQKYDVRCDSIDTPVGTLSGGNMQKVLLARETSNSPKLLIVEQPTQGLDIGAIEYVRKVLLEKREEGAAVLLISADLDEVLELSDRIAVMYEGKMVYTCKQNTINREEIGLAMAGMLERK